MYRATLGKEQVSLSSDSITAASSFPLPVDIITSYLLSGNSDWQGLSDRTAVFDAVVGKWDRRAWLSRSNVMTR